MRQQFLRDQGDAESRSRKVKVMISHRESWRRNVRMLAFLSVALFASTMALAQMPEALRNVEAQTLLQLPSAPVPQAVGNNLPSSAPPVANAGPVRSLSVKDAEALAIKNNPQISVARLTALASRQVTREAKSSLWPTVTGDITGVDAESGSRITAGALNNPIIYERAAGGLSVTQLITDFGRTANLISSASYAAKAQNENAIATKEQILLAVNQAFFSALQAKAVLTVAQETVKERQKVADQVGTLFKNKLKSELDFSFASVNLAQAQLLLLDAQNNQNATQATLSMILGYASEQNFQLVEDGSAIAPPPGNVDDLISQAFVTRPEIRSLDFQYQAAKKFQAAERDLLFPNIRAMGAIGMTPVGNPAVAPDGNAFNNTYGAVGGDVEIPIFNGFLFNARAKEAALRAKAVDERLRDMRNLISRDVRTSWLNANTAYQRLSVTQQLLEQARLALNLAQSRYNLGLASIVELSQAQLQETQGEIGNVQASYDYRLSLAMLTYETTGIQARK
jgi:outer membrane protein